MRLQLPLNLSANVERIFKDCGYDSHHFRQVIPGGRRQEQQTAQPGHMRPVAGQDPARAKCKH